jgi:hypothetical protein
MHDPEEGVMKKTGKAGLGHLTKMEKTSRRVAAARAVLAA